MCLASFPCAGAAQLELRWLVHRPGARPRLGGVHGAPRHFQGPLQVGRCLRVMSHHDVQLTRMLLVGWHGIAACARRLRAHAHACTQVGCMHACMTVQGHCPHAFVQMPSACVLLACTHAHGSMQAWQQHHCHVRHVRAAQGPPRRHPRPHEAPAHQHALRMRRGERAGACALAGAEPV